MPARLTRERIDDIGTRVRPIDHCLHVFTRAHVCRSHDDGIPFPHRMPARLPIDATDRDTTRRVRIVQTLRLTRCDDLVTPTHALVSPYETPPRCDSR